MLAAEGSYLLNIQAHADDGEHNVYVMNLVLAHKRQWGGRLVDEFCWAAVCSERDRAGRRPTKARTMRARRT